MTRILLLSAHKVIKILETAGFQIVSQKGSHIRIKKELQTQQLLLQSLIMKKFPAGL